MWNIKYLLYVLLVQVLLLKVVESVESTNSTNSIDGVSLNERTRLLLTKRPSKVSSVQKFFKLQDVKSPHLIRRRLKKSCTKGWRWDDNKGFGKLDKCYVCAVGRYQDKNSR